MDRPTYANACRHPERKLGFAMVERSRSPGEPLYAGNQRGAGSSTSVAFGRIVTGGSAPQTEEARRRGSLAELRFFSASRR